MAFVVSANLLRRHLTPSQCASIAAKMANVKLGDNQHSRVGNVADPSVSQSEAAGMMGVSERSVRKARKVQEKGTPALQRAVDDGKISVTEESLPQTRSTM